MCANIWPLILIFTFTYKYLVSYKAHNSLILLLHMLVCFEFDLNLRAADGWATNLRRISDGLEIFLKDGCRKQHKRKRQTI